MNMNMNMNMKSKVMNMYKIKKKEKKLAIMTKIYQIIMYQTPTYGPKIEKLLSIQISSKCYQRGAIFVLMTNCCVSVFLSGLES
jgi:hypothetical protein